MVITGLVLELITKSSFHILMAIPYRLISIIDGQNLTPFVCEVLNIDAPIIYFHDKHCTFELTKRVYA